MKHLRVWCLYSLFFIAFGLPFGAYGNEQAADIFEKSKEEKVEATATFFITPREVKQNYRRYHPINRSVTKIDHFTIAERHYYNFQDLGNHWTAAQHVFYQLPEHIGANYGNTVYDFYFRAPQDIRYYHTCRAYANFNIVLANLGSFVFNGCYIQRLLDNWHIGTNWYGAMAENEWPHSKDDKIVNAFPNFELFTHLKSPDECYHLFTSYANMRYLTKETGGVRSSKKTDQFLFENKDPVIRCRSALPLVEEAYMQNKIDANNKFMHKDTRTNFYLYHHYEYSQPIIFYHELHYLRKKNLLTIQKLDYALLGFISNSSPGSIYDLSSNSKEYSSVFMQSFANEIGVKGDIAKPDLFYSVHYKVDAIDLDYDFSHPEVFRSQEGYNRPPLKAKKKEKEHYLGGSTRLNISKNSKILLDGAYLLEKGGYHKLNLAYQHKCYQLAYHTIKHKKPYILTYGYSKYRLWNMGTRFLAPSAQAIDVAAWYKWAYMAIHPILSLKKLDNHIYYRKARSDNGCHDHCVSEPVQATTPIYLLSLQGNLNFSIFSCFHIDNTFTILEDLTKGVKVFKGYIPPYIYTGRYYYADRPYGKKMDIETGLNLHFKELYYGDGYDVIAQQFYRQNQFAVQGRPIFDIFCNVRINNLKLSFKYSYINEFFHKPSAYFSTPFYLGLKKAADIGIDWSFFD